LSSSQLLHLYQYQDNFQCLTNHIWTSIIHYPNATTSHQICLCRTTDLLQLSQIHLDKHISTYLEFRLHQYQVALVGHIVFSFQCQEKAGVGWRSGVASHAKVVSRET
jgi:hypothetical protein